MVPQPRKQQGSAIRRENLEFEVLALLDAEPGISQREMSRRLGASLGRTNGCVKAMIAVGSIANGRDPSSGGGGARGYRLTPAGHARRMALAQAYLQRKQAELDRLAGQVDRLQRAASAGIGDTHP